MYGWLAVVALVLTSCDSENVTPIDDKTLPEVIAKDFHERCEDYTIKRVMEWITAHYKGSEVLGFVNDSGDDNYLIMHDGVLKSVYFRVSRKGTTWKETCYPLPKGTTVPSNVLDSLHADYPDFTYTEVSILETPNGIVYLFTDGNRPDRLGHYVEAN